MRRILLPAAIVAGLLAASAPREAAAALATPGIPGITAAAPGGLLEPVYYYRGRYYPYRYRGGYYPYRYRDQYFRNRYYRSGRWHYY